MRILVRLRLGGGARSTPLTTPVDGVGCVAGQLGQGLRSPALVLFYLLGATSHAWLGLLAHVGMLCAAQPPRGGATLLAAAPATSACLYWASVKPLGCCLVSAVATCCAYARCVPGRTGGIMPATNKGACGAAACAALLPVAALVVATVPAPVAAVAGAAVRLAVVCVLAFAIVVAFTFVALALLLGHVLVIATQCGGNKANKK